MTTVSQLLAFDAYGWERAADGARAQAKLATATSHELTDQAGALGKSWPDLVGAMAAAKLRELAASYTELATHYGDGAAVIDEAARSMGDRQNDLLNLQATVAGHGDMQGPDDNGVVRCTLSTPGLFPPDVTEIITFLQERTWAKQQTLAAREILMRADGHDREATIALMGLIGVELPPSDDGPVDLTDAGLVLQADLNNQAGYGDCVSLSTLIGIAHSDPDFVREHLKYDPATGTYEVTLYRDGKPVTVSVDPSTLPKDGSDQSGGTGRPSWLAVYEQALQQEFGDIRHGQTLETPAERITGQDSHETDTLSPDEIRAALDRHPPAVITAGTDDTSHAQPDDVDPTKRMVPGHAYNVRGVDSSGNIVLQNPWGPNGGYGPNNHYYPGVVHLTPSEYEAWCYGNATTDLP